MIQCNRSGIRGTGGARGLRRLAAAALLLALCGCDPLTSLFQSLIVPSTPVGLSVTTDGTDSLTVSWNAADWAAGYALFRDGSAAGPFTAKIYEGAGRTFTDAPLSAGTAYFYRVLASNAAGSSPLSAAASGTTSPAAPGGLAVAGASATALLLSWDAVDGAAGYRVYRDSSATGSFSTEVFDGTAVSFLDSGLLPRTTYWYAVACRKETLSSALSAPVPGTTTEPVGSDITHDSRTGAFTYEADLGAMPRSVYFVFTNPGASSAASRPTVTALSAAAGAQDGRRSSTSDGSARRSGWGFGIPDKPEVQAFNADPWAFVQRSTAAARSLVPAVRRSDVAGVSRQDLFDDLGNAVPSTCLRVVGPVSVAGGGTRTLNVWVADDCRDGTKATTVTQDMVDRLADKFLASGTDNDIYDWVTNIYGAEWGASDGDLDAYYIQPDSQITILLCDIDGDNATNGGTVGLYYAKDNFLKEYWGTSNERIMFYIDAVMFADPSDFDDATADAWSMDDHWPSTIVSTLAHEFQHMINYYQKSVLRAGSTDTWLDELLSMATEDVVSDKIGSIGPRGVAYDDMAAGDPGNTDGRLPRYNHRNYVSLTEWLSGDDVYYSYSINYAFGAYLTRNFGGVRLLRDIVWNDFVDSTAVDAALAAGGYAVTFQDLLAQWGAANLVSDSTGAPEGYRYNAGGAFTSALDGVTYRQGSIDLFRYSYEDMDGPFLWTTSPVGSAAQASTSSLYFLAGAALTGSRAWDITLPAGVELTVVLK